MFSFCDKLFGLVVKDIEAMDASILKGEPATGKKQQKVTLSARSVTLSCSSDGSGWDSVLSPVAFFSLYQTNTLHII